VPQWLIDERQATMQVDDQVLNCTVFLGSPLEHGFAAEGTGFVLHVPEEGLSFLYIVTCRHVVEPTASVRDLTPNDDPIWIRLNREGDKPPKVIKTKRSEWLFPKERYVDVCVYPFDKQMHDADDDLALVTLNTSSTNGIIFTDTFQAHWGLALGDEIFMVSCFVGRVGDRKNIPVIRLGSIAAKPSEPAWGGSHQSPAYLIETRSLGGTSGSPVFLHVNPGRRLREPELRQLPDGGGTIAPYYLIGMMQGFHSGQYASDFVANDDEQKVVPVDTDFNAGIGVAIPISQIMDLINRPDLKEARMATLEAKRKQTGHHDASAPQPKVFPPTGDAEPNHRERFTALLDAAVKKPAQEG
jgi:Trypsin-like peptidase domain